MDQLESFLESSIETSKVSVRNMDVMHDGSFLIIRISEIISSPREIILVSLKSVGVKRTPVIGQQRSPP